MKDRGFVTPALVRDDEATPLRRIPLDERTFEEVAFQDLLFAHLCVAEGDRWGMIDRVRAAEADR